MSNLLHNEILTFLIGAAAKDPNPGTATQAANWKTLLEDEAKSLLASAVSDAVGVISAKLPPAKTLTATTGTSKSTPVVTSVESAPSPTHEPPKLATLPQTHPGVNIKEPVFIAPPQHSTGTPVPKK